MQSPQESEDQLGLSGMADTTSLSELALFY